MAGISMRVFVGHQPKGPLAYERPQLGLWWSGNRQELHARFKPVNLITELLYGGVGLLLLISLACTPLLLLLYGREFFLKQGAAESVAVIALGFPLMLLWCLLTLQSVSSLVRRITNHHTHTTLYATSEKLVISCPTEWAPPQQHFPADQIRRIDVHTSGWDLSLARIVYLRIWTGDDYRLTEIRFSTMEADLPDRLMAALKEALGLSTAGRRRLNLAPTAAVVA